MILRIFTMTMGGPIREAYLREYLHSIAFPVDHAFGEEHAVKQTVFFQGTPPTNSLTAFMKRYRVEHVVWRKNRGRALGQVAALEHLGVMPDDTLVLRTDDDARILEIDFLTTMVELHQLYPDAFLHAFPVGLTGNMGGCRARKDREVAIGPTTKHLYTMRPVKRMGGLARAASLETWRKIPWVNCLGKGSGMIESAQMMRACREQDIQQYYVENRWVVEHQDGTLGQVYRRKHPELEA
jgi:hypothetical protein